MEKHCKRVDQTFAVNEVVGSDQKEPGDGSEPGQAVHTIHRIPDCDNLLKTLHLHG